MYGRPLKKYELDNKTHSAVTGILINRADLHLTLYHIVKDTVYFRFGDELSSVALQEKNVKVSFASGKQETFDLVIGADGVHSKTRNLAFGAGFEKDLSKAYFAFIVPNRTKLIIARERELIGIRGDGFWIAYGIYSTGHSTSQSEIGGYIFHGVKPFAAVSPRDRRSYMIAHYGKYNRNFMYLLETLTDDDFIFRDRMTQIAMPAWHKDRVCLVGDAAHCPSPASGVGASMAMAGAYILARRLLEFQQYDEALAAYEAHLRPYITKIQEAAIPAAEFVAGKSFLPYGVINTLFG